MGIAHKGSQLPIKTCLPVDKDTVFLAHYDVTAEESVRGVPFHSDPVATLRPFEGKYGGAVAVEEPMTNLFTGSLTVYNNFGMPATLEKTGELLYGADVWRLTMTPQTAQQLSSLQLNLWNHGVFFPRMDFLANTKYAASLYWKPITHADTEFGGTASNISGWTSGEAITYPNNWRRYTQYRGPLTEQKSDSIYFSMKSPSVVMNQPMVIEVACPQVETGRHTPTSYYPGTRAIGSLSYPKEVINPSQGTLSFWTNIKGKQTYGNPGFVNIGGWTSPVTKDWFSIYWGTPWNNADNISFTIHNGKTGAGKAASVSFSVLPQTWYFIAITWDFVSTKRITLTVYQENGTKYQSIAATDTMTQPTFEAFSRFDVGSGKDWVPNSATNTLFDELRIDKVAKSLEEIDIWFQSSAPFYPKGIHRVYG